VLCSTYSPENRLFGTDGALCGKRRTTIRPNTFGRARYNNRIELVFRGPVRGYVVVVHQSDAPDKTEKRSFDSEWSVLTMARLRRFGVFELDKLFLNRKYTFYGGNRLRIIRAVWLRAKEPRGR